jgi:inner membrane protein
MQPKTMSRNGHLLTALALGVVVTAIYPTEGGLLTAVGAVIGSSAPDQLEFPSWNHLGERSSFIPHRSITHFVPAWIVCAMISNQIQSPWSNLLFGIALSAMLHILIDYGSPCGVPILHPFRRHKLARPWYRTGTASEFPVIAMFLVVAGGALLARGHVMVLALRGLI